MIRRIAVPDTERCVGCQICMYACSMRYGDGGLERSALIVKSLGGFERGFAVVVCRACEDPPCAASCPEGALIVREHGGVRLLSSKCTGCMICISACSLGAIFWDREKGKPIVCTYCGICAKHCPHNVLIVEEVS
ncbi:MAG: 4Fe-4S binding protein [Candidatus Methanodesulfokora washburnensis]|jgi:Fe-S-cluster-containing dehydrogenase component|nr:4Fe-4S binding protein [Candidatus Methanodesulfokores washburnensis]